MRAARLARDDRLAHDYADENDDEQHAIRVKLLSLSKQLHAADNLSKTMQARDYHAEHELSVAPTRSGGDNRLSVSKVLPLTNAAARYA